MAAMTTAARCRLVRTRSDDRGAALIEYALLIGLIAVVCIVAVGVLGGNVSTQYSTSADQIDQASN